MVIQKWDTFFKFRTCNASLDRNAVNITFSVIILIMVAVQFSKLMFNRLNTSASPHARHKGTLSSFFEEKSKKGGSYSCTLLYIASFFIQVSNARLVKWYNFYSTEVKRAESMRAEYNKKSRRTPSFTTRRRTQSFRKLHGHKIVETLDQLPPVEKQGLLDRKHELQSGGKKAPVRSWKTFFTGSFINLILKISVRLYVQ